MLASARMLTHSNPAPNHRRRGAPLHRHPHPRTAVVRPKLHPNYVYITPKLESCLSYRKHTISQFLIDNSCKSFFPAAASPASSLKPLASRPNRPSPRLEMPVSHRKQTIGPISNRPQFAFYNFALVGSGRLRTTFALETYPPRLSTDDCKLSSLIANETHSRGESSHCKRSTYEILIANEFQSYAQRQTALSSASFVSYDSFAPSTPSVTPRHRSLSLGYNGEVKSNCTDLGDLK